MDKKKSILRTQNTAFPLSMGSEMGWVKARWEQVEE